MNWTELDVSADREHVRCIEFEISADLGQALLAHAKEEHGDPLTPFELLDSYCRPQEFPFRVRCEACGCVWDVKGSAR